jgi:hypothetical protein
MMLATNRRVSRIAFFSVLLLMGFSVPRVFAQDTPENNPMLRGEGGTAQTSSAKATSSARASVAQTSGVSGPQSSPFNPDPEANPVDDNRFVVNGGSGLDTGCTFRDGGPLRFDIEITRYVGPVGANGKLSNPGALVSSGVVSPRAKLSMPSFDVDANAQPEDGAPEVDQVLFNGQPIGVLDGRDNDWVPNSFEVPIERVKFPTRGTQGSAPSPAENTVTIKIDQANSDEKWCTSVDWAALSFEAVSPTIFVHGLAEDAAFFDRQGLAGDLKARDLPIDGCGSCQNPIELTDSDPRQNTPRQNGEDLGEMIPGIVKSFGADSYHLVAHSKGGLDTRVFLASYGRSSNLKLLSYNSISTPHDGTVLADLFVKYGTALERGAEKDEFNGFPASTDKVISFGYGVRGGAENLESLTTAWLADFNTTNRSRLPGNAFYNTLAADADENGNDRIDSEPNEFKEFVAEGPSFFESLSGAPIGWILDRPYQIIRQTRGVKMNLENRTVPVKGVPVDNVRVAVFDAVSATNRDNDILVAAPSAHGRGSFSRITRQSPSAIQGENHVSVVNVAGSRIIPWIFQAERALGDL